MEDDSDLPTLIVRKEHLNVLRYIRVHELRQPELVVKHGKAWLGDDLSKGSASGVGGLTGLLGGAQQGTARLAALEQICVAALDLQDHTLASLALTRLREGGVDRNATRFRLLLAQCLEAAGDASGADIIYDDLLKENPSNLTALKRKYCLCKAAASLNSSSSSSGEGQTTTSAVLSAKDRASRMNALQVEAQKALTAYLQQNPSDLAAWYQLAQNRKDMGDFKGAIYALEEVLLGLPIDPKIHVELAECYATLAASASSSSSSDQQQPQDTPTELLLLARKHMAQALELDPHNRRAQFGLVSVANAYLLAVEATSQSVLKKKNSTAADSDEGTSSWQHEVLVAKELVRYGSETVLNSYANTSMQSTMQTLMAEYTQDLD